MNTVVAIKEALHDILNRRQDVVLLAAKQRSKFEHWLKFELAVTLPTHLAVQGLRTEDPYPISQEKGDLSWSLGDVKWYLELKTSNVNWRAEGLENRTRPITNNITTIIRDVHKLRDNCGAAKGVAAFVLFPIPTRIWEEERSKLTYHLARIERECELPSNTLVDGADFVKLDPKFGVAVFVVAAN